MSQDENRENNGRDEGAAGKAEGSAETGEMDNVPVESIGSYARVEELLTDEEMENTTRLDSES